MAKRHQTIENSENQDASEIEYQKKRKRNNQAVQRCREKTKRIEQKIEESVENLKQDNIKLEVEIANKKNSVLYFRKMLLDFDASEKQERAIQEIIGEDELKLLLDEKAVG